MEFDAKQRPEVAVLGYACRLPGADGLEQAWSVLAEGRCAVTQMPEDRWSSLRFMDPAGLTRGRSYVRKAGIIEDVWAFDPHFFGISPREAEIMDPQQRMLLETAARAFDHAGVDPAQLDPKRSGVYIGASNADHAVFGVQNPAKVEAYFGLGNTLSILANRISYHWNLQGPSVTLDSACSSGLVALDRARRDILTGEIDLAVVGGVNLLLSPGPFIAFSAAGMLSRKGLCQSFAADADGYVRSEGAVVFILQRADAAAAAGRPVRSIVAGSGVCADGRTNGLTVPSEIRQAELVSQVLREAGLKPDDIAFAEAHGTGTAVGDPREALSLGMALGRSRSAPLLIGSAKSNFGHLEPASGLVGMLKAQMALEQGLIPASLHASIPNPGIDFSGLNLEIVQEPTPIAPRDAPWAAVVNSFGFGGTNASVVLRQPAWVHVPRDVETGVPPSLLLTAGTQQALSDLARIWCDRARAPDPAFGTAVSNANRQLARHSHRLCTPAGSPEQLSQALAGWLEGSAGPGVSVSKGGVVGNDRPVAFVFCGNGAVWEGMARGLYQGDAAFRLSFDQTAERFGEVAGRSLAQALWEPDPKEGYARGDVAQALLLAVQLGIVDALAAAGVRPVAVLGHSAGEIAAATVAGRLSRAGAVRLIRIRSAIMERLRGKGTMAVLGAAPDRTRALIADLGLTVEIAAENAPDNVTLSGDRAELGSLLKEARKRGIAGKLMLVDYPFHSRFIEEVREDFLAALGDMHAPGQEPIADPEVAFVSGWRGTEHPEGDLDADYWCRNAREPVAFRAGVEHLARIGCGVLLEIGPRPVLLRDMRETLAAAGQRTTPLATLRENGTDPVDASHFARAVLCAGGRVSEDLLLGPRRAFVTVPPEYPFDRQIFRIDTGGGLNLSHDMTEHVFLGWRERLDNTIWRGSLSLARMPWLADHAVGDTVLFPATGILSMLSEAARQALGTETCELRDVEFLRPIELQPGKEHATLVIYEPIARRLTLSTGAPGSWSLVAVAAVFSGEAATLAPLNLDASQGTEKVYAALTAANLNYGPAFRQVSLATNHGTHVDAVAVAGEATPERWVTCVDSFLHAISPLLENTAVSRDRQMVPRRFGRIRHFSSQFPVGARLSLRGVWADGACADAVLVDGAGAVVASLEEIRLHSLAFPEPTPALWDEIAVSVPGYAPPALADAVQAVVRSEGAVASDLDVLREAVGDRLAWDAVQSAMTGWNLADARTGLALDRLVAKGMATLDEEGVPSFPPEPPLPGIETLAALLAQTVPEAADMLRATLRDPADDTPLSRRIDRTLAELGRALLLGAGVARPRRMLLSGEVDKALCKAACALGDHVTVTAPDQDRLERLRSVLGQIENVRYATLDELAAQAARVDLIIGVAMAQTGGAEAAERLTGLLSSGGECLFIEEVVDIFSLMTERHTSPDALERLRTAASRSGVEIAFAPAAACGSVMLGYGRASIRASTDGRLVVSGDTPLADALRLEMPEDQPVVASVLALEAGSDISSSVARGMAIARMEPQDHPHWIVCEGDDITAAELSGWRRVVANETGRDIRVLTFAPGRTAQEVVRAILGSSEQELRLTDAGLYSMRIVSLPEPGTVSVAEADARQLGLKRRSALLDGLVWQDAQRRSPKAGEIEIAVAATGLNFRDVMWAQGLLPHEALEEGSAGMALGLECSGVVVRVGSASRFAVGDRVMAACSGGFSSHLTVPDVAAMPVPDDMTLDLAAALPVVFQTAVYALNEVARIAPGESVLIHGAAGGVGLAAIQVAQAAGARVLVTAGSPAKRRFLQALGIDDVFDSRTLGFEDAVRAATGGRGVDVVLNSLAGEAMERSVACLAPFGRFLELGKRDFMANSPLGLRAMRRNISYHGIDLDQVMAQRPERALRALEQVIAGFRDGTLRPLPIEVFDADTVEAAFRHMQRSGHIGKIVVRAPRLKVRDTDGAVHPAPDLGGRWLIVGGTKGFGLVTAEWLAGQGAKEVWLASRGGTVEDDALLRLEATGTAVHAVALDVTDAQAVDALGARIAETAGPLHGIVHAAMVLHDALLAGLDAGLLSEVLAVKIDGARNLAALADAHAVRHFWLYSSVASRFGNPWQAPYAAANHVLDAMARVRRAEGKPGLAVAWGPIGDAGYLARTPDLRDLADRLGPLLSAREALDRLGRVLAHDPGRATITIAPARWGKVRHDLPVIAGPLFDLLDTRRGAQGEAMLDIRGMIATLGEAQARKAVLELLTAETARILHMAPSEVDPLRPLDEMGFDSLMAMSLKIAIEEKLGMAFAATELRAGLNLSMLVNALFENLDTEASDMAVEAELIRRHVTEGSVSENLRAKIIKTTNEMVEEYVELR